jgi:hypothetical protein
MDLKTLYQLLSDEDRKAVAARAGISPLYLYQLSSGFRHNPPILLCRELVIADERLSLDELAEQFARQRTEREARGPATKRLRKKAPKRVAKRRLRGPS